MKVTNEGIEVYFNDLDFLSQAFFLKALHMKDEKEGNFDVVPIAIVQMQEK